MFWGVVYEFTKVHILEEYDKKLRMTVRKLPFLYQKKTKYD